MIANLIHESTEGVNTGVLQQDRGKRLKPNTRKSQIRGRLWGALCTQYWEGDNLTQEEIKRDTTVVITVFQHRTAAGLEAIELELVVVEKPARMVILQMVLRLV
ncbi:hypothetical protein L3X38_013289 [Prunus dulcis]|uniref:Uncharacterized protein n=1 Tax=Prunus dulcis TaxID=3755 RepID=A0AAD4ZG15_PRUDU|nr:hypothetical protein L3X38_013289 [Prunus dulcis]